MFLNLSGAPQIFILKYLSPKALLQIITNGFQNGIYCAEPMSTLFSDNHYQLLHL
jgi:hypothetical protein